MRFCTIPGFYLKSWNEYAVPDGTGNVCDEFLPICDPYGIDTGHSPIQKILYRFARYIQNQEEHHRKKTFMEEYTRMLDEFEVPYDDRFLFKELE